jgi:5,10-methylenetetrahydromethanopterin reductase
MDEYIQAVKAMLRGEAPEVLMEGQRRKMGFLNPEAKLINIEDEIPIYISALGPRTRRMTAALDANWINVNFSEDFSARAAREMDATYMAAGRDPDRKRKTIWVFGSVLRDGEGYDSPRIKAEVGCVAMMALHNAMEAQNYGSVAGEFGSTGEPNPGLEEVFREYRKLYESFTPSDARYMSLHKGHLMFVRPDEDRFATPELIQGMTTSGTAAELRDRLRRLKAAGYNEIVVQITPGCETMLDDWARVFETV